MARYKLNAKHKDTKPYAIELNGPCGNSIEIVNFVIDCMLKDGMTTTEVEDYTVQALSGDYDNPVNVSQEIIDKLNKQ